MTATLASALRRAAAELRATGVPDAAADARLLMAAAAGIGREAMFRDPGMALEPAAAARFDAMVRRRAAREPVSRILGRREFRSLDFALGPDTLDPRPDSETLVEAALDAMAGRTAAPRILDIGTGTGCLLLSLLHEMPDASGVGTDVAPGACAVARDNARRLGLGDRAAFVVCEWAGAVGGRFDLVVSNPPYVAAGEFAGLSPEVAAHDPRRALDGGADGLDAYRAIAAGLARVLAPRGVAVVEIGHRQAGTVNEIFRNCGYLLSDSRKDFGGRPRCLAFCADLPPDSREPAGKKRLETK